MENKTITIRELKQRFKDAFDKQIEERLQGDMTVEDAEKFAKTADESMNEVLTTMVATCATVPMPNFSQITNLLAQVAIANKFGNIEDLMLVLNNVASIITLISAAEKRQGIDVLAKELEAESESERATRIIADENFTIKNTRVMLSSLLNLLDKYEDSFFSGNQVSLDIEVLDVPNSIYSTDADKTSSKIIDRYIEVRDKRNDVKGGVEYPSKPIDENDIWADDILE